MIKKNIIQTILKDTNYHLSLFADNEIDALLKKVFVKTTRGKETPFVNCIVRDKDIQLKPEEIVRQLRPLLYVHSQTTCRFSILFASTS